MSNFGYISQRPTSPAPPIGPVSVEEQLRVLNNHHSISPNFSDFVDYICQEQGREYVEKHPYSSILTILGSKRNVEGNWIPCSNQLLLVDTEEFESPEWYYELLEDLSRISNGIVSIKNIEINWDIKHKKPKEWLALAMTFGINAPGTPFINKMDGFIYGSSPI